MHPAIYCHLKLTLSLNSSNCYIEGNEWECSVNFEWALELHEAGILVNGHNLTCQDESKKNDSWFKWNYSIIQREIYKKVGQFFFGFFNINLR